MRIHRIPHTARETRGAFYRIATNVPFPALQWYKKKSSLLDSTTSRATKRNKKRSEWVTKKLQRPIKKESLTVFKIQLLICPPKPIHRKICKHI